MSKVKPCGDSQRMRARRMNHHVVYNVIQPGNHPEPKNQIGIVLQFWEVGTAVIIQVTVGHVTINLKIQ